MVTARTLFICFDEIPYRHRQQRFFGCRERIDAQLLFQAGDQHGDAERIEPRIEQRDIVIEWGYHLAVLARNPRYEVHDG
jgi:hypothetical protein